MTTRILKNRRGTSLVGLLIGAAILSSVIIPLFLAFQSTRKGSVRSLNSLIGANVSAAIIERYKSKSFSELEGIMMGLDPDNMEVSTKYINGPFQTVPPKPSIIENEVHRAGNVIFNAAIYLSYFPEPNPNPDSPDFNIMRKRMTIIVDVSWNERTTPGNFVIQHFTCTTMVHDEKYSSKPSLGALGNGSSNQ
jgi:hypothetical protein